MPNPVTKSELARLGKVTPAAVSHMVTRGNFDGATLDGNKLDRDHPSIVEWLETRDEIPSAEDLSLAQYEDLTIRQIVKGYGSIEKLENCIKVRKMIAETEYKKIQMQASRDELVSREFVAKACFGIVEDTFSKLLDMPRGAVGKISAILDTKALGVKEESEQVLTEEISKIIKASKRQIAERLTVKMTDVKRILDDTE